MESRFVFQILPISSRAVRDAPQFESGNAAFVSFWTVQCIKFQIFLTFILSARQMSQHFSRSIKMFMWDIKLYYGTCLVLSVDQSLSIRERVLPSDSDSRFRLFPRFGLALCCETMEQQNLF